MADIDLKRLLQDKKYRKSLTNLQLSEVLKQINTLIAASGSIDVPDNPADFAAKFSGGDWVHAPHLTILSQWIKEAVEGKRKRILVSMPPRHGKSELISFWTPLWLLAIRPKSKILFASYEHTFAEKWGRRVRDAIIAFGDKLHLQLSESATAAARWELTSGGLMETSGAGGSMTGKGADCLIIDDPIKNDEEARSEIERENKWEWFQTTAFTRLEPGGFVIIVATRWHEDDLLGRIEKQVQNGGPNWDILKFKAIAGEDDPLGRTPGSALWPARYSKEDLNVIKATLSPYHWGALYQQNPTPEEGNAVKREWWRFYGTPNNDRPRIEDFDQVIQSWDTSFKDMEDSDYTVGQVWGRKGAMFYLIDQVRDRMNGYDLIQAIRRFSSMYPHATAKLIEDSANGPAVISILEREVPGMIPIRARANKFSRLQGAIPLIAAKNVYLPQNFDGTQIKWVGELIEELAAFPNSTYDDQVDATSQALNFMKPAGWVQMDKEFKSALKSTPDTAEAYRRLKVTKWKDRALKKSARLINAQSNIRRGGSRKVW